MSGKLKEGFIRSDEGRIFMQRVGTKIIRGEDRPGIRAGDWLKETTDAAVKTDKTQVEKPRALIETQSVVNADRLTASDVALHEYLLACARQQGIKKPVHEVPVKQLLGYLEIRSITRLEESLERLSGTLIRYNVRDEDNQKYHRSWVQMIRVILTDDLKSGTSTLAYEIPDVVRTAILQSRDYAWIDINILPKFRSKYATRLYVKLALMAGMTKRMRKPWRPTPMELAEFLGYPIPDDGKLHFGSFKRAVDRALDDIRKHVKRFTFKITSPERMCGRGGPMDVWKFTTSSARRDMMSTPAVKFSKAEARRVARREIALEHHQTPNPLLVARAARYTGMPMDAVSFHWREVFRNREKDLDREIGGMTRRQVIDMVEADGVGKAFEAWIETCYGPRGTPRKPHRQSEARGLEIEAENNAAAAAYIPRSQETPEQRKIRRIAAARKSAASLLLDHDREPIPDVRLQRYVEEGALYLCNNSFIEEMETRGKADVFRRSLACLLKRDPKDARQSVLNLYQAVADWDIDQLIKISIGIAAHDQRRSKPTKPSFGVKRIMPTLPTLAPHARDLDLPIAAPALETSDDIPF